MVTRSYSKHGPSTLRALKVSATPDMVATLLQHAGLVQAPPLPLPVPRPAVDWTEVVWTWLSATEQIIAAIKARDDSGRS